MTDACACRHLTEADLNAVLEQFVAAVRANDAEAANAVLAAVEPCRRNVGMLAHAMAGRTGSLVRATAAIDLGAGEVFASPVVPSDAPEHVVHAARMLAVATNGDEDMLAALVDAFLDRTEQMPDPDAVVASFSCVVSDLARSLRGAVLLYDRAGGGR